jgi:homoserine kinase type II
MAVFTQLSTEEIASFLKLYDIGELVSASGIAEGTENTNYLLEVSHNGQAQRYILTVFERRISVRDLPFFLSLAEWFAERGIPCPKPVKAADGSVVMQVQGKPAALIHFLEGKNNPVITHRHLEMVGTLIGKMHLLAKPFPHTRRNTLSLDGWKKMFAGFRHRADEISPGLEKEIADELDFLTAHWPKDLPSGAVHTDLFPDNIFFQADAAGNPVISGVIDFYFACTDIWVYDLMVAVNAWCFDTQYRFVREASASLILDYNHTRSITLPERQAMPVLARGAAIRFLVTRSHDWLNRVEGALVTVKDPLEYLAKLRFHREIADYREYGLL